MCDSETAFSGTAFSDSVTAFDEISAAAGALGRFQVRCGVGGGGGT